MGDLLGTVGMMGNYESRKVGRLDKGKLSVSTVAVTDSDQPYETAVAHPRYNSGRRVIVEMYDTRKAAEAGHEKWVKTMTARKLPDQLVNVSTAGIAQLCDAFGDGDWRTWDKKVRMPKKKVK